MPLAAVKDLMTNSIASQDKFGHGTLESTFTAIESSDIMGQIDSETTVVVTLADCEKTHMMNDDLMMNEMNEQLIHFAVSDLTCNRLSGESFLLPVTTPETSLIQLVTDFKSQNTFYNWTSYIVIHDDSIDMEMEEQLYELLSV